MVFDVIAGSSHVIVSSGNHSYIVGCWVNLLLLAFTLNIRNYQQPLLSPCALNTVTCRKTPLFFFSVFVMFSLLILTAGGSLFVSCNCFIADLNSSERTVVLPLTWWRQMLISQMWLNQKIDGLTTWTVLLLMTNQFLMYRWLIVTLLCQHTSKGTWRVWSAALQWRNILKVFFEC